MNVANEDIISGGRRHTRAYGNDCHLYSTPGVNLDYGENINYNDGINKYLYTQLSLECSIALKKKNRP